MKRALGLLGTLAILLGIAYYSLRDYKGLLPLIVPAPPFPSGEALPFSLPEGFAAYLFADNVPGARVMIRDPKGALLVSDDRAGAIYHIVRIRE